MENELMDFCKIHSACDSGVEWARANGITTLSDAYECCSRGDWLIWLLRKANKLSKEQKVKIAVVCAEHVLPIFERKRPNDNRPRKAIEAAKAWLKEPTEKIKFIAAAAAYAAASVADTAYAAAASASDASAAAAAYAAAAYAATYAASVAASDAAAAAADAAKERKWQANRIRKIVKNPWRGK